MNTTNKFFASFFLKKYKLRKIQSDNLNNILKKYSNKNNRFNLIDIDAEGSDYSILKKINFKKYIFQLILIETHTFNSKTKNEKRDELIGLISI